MELDYVRKLQWFNEEISEYYISEEDITYLSADQLKDMLKIGDQSDPELLGGYNVPKKHIYKLQQYLKHQIDTEKYDYQIGCYAKD